MELVPCGGCARHVRAGERTCPFCGERVVGPAPIRRVARGSTRAAIFYLGATLASGGCDAIAGGAMYGGPPVEETIAQPYGAPPDPEPPPEEPVPPEETIAQPYGAPPDPEPPPEEPEAPPELGDAPLDRESAVEGSMGQPYGAAPKT